MFACWWGAHEQILVPALLLFVCAVDLSHVHALDLSHVHALDLSSAPECCAYCWHTISGFLLCMWCVAQTSGVKVISVSAVEEGQEPDEFWDLFHLG